MPEELGAEPAEEAALLADDLAEPALEVRLLIALEALPIAEGMTPVPLVGAEGRGAGVTEGATGTTPLETPGAGTGATELPGAGAGAGAELPGA